MMNEYMVAMWKWIKNKKNKKVKEEQPQKSTINYIEKYKEFAERVRKMFDEEFRNTDFSAYMHLDIMHPPFVITEMVRRGMIEGPA